MQMVKPYSIYSLIFQYYFKKGNAYELIFIQMFMNNT